MKNLNEFKFEKYDGSEPYHFHLTLNNHFLITDGCKYVRDEGNTYWLFDTILDYQTDKRLQNQKLQGWTLRKEELGYWTLTCDDGDEDNPIVLIKQEIPYSNFPLTRIEFMVLDEVCMLRSEYYSIWDWFYGSD